MRNTNITTKDHQILINKLSLEKISGKRAPHPIYTYAIDGKEMLRVSLPNVHGKTSLVSPGFLGAIKKDLFLKPDELVELVRCTLSSKVYKQMVSDRS
jgi:hypothetical protein